MTEFLCDLEGIEDRKTYRRVDSRVRALLRDHDRVAAEVKKIKAERNRLVKERQQMKREIKLLLQTRDVLSNLQYLVDLSGKPKE
jgi:hypothetical protein